MRHILRIGHACNEDCIFCFNKFNNPLSTQSSEEIKKGINSLAEIDDGTLAFAGGEPTLLKDLPELISYAKKNFNQVGIQTNAIKLSDMGYLKKLVNFGLDYAFISLHSHSKQTSEELTKTKNSFDKTIQGIKNSLSLNLTTEINHVITKQNYKHLPEFVNFVKEISPKILIEFSFPLTGQNIKKNKSFTPQLSDIRPYLIEALGACLKNNLKFRLGECSIPYCFLDPYIGYTSEFKLMKDFIKNKRLDTPNSISLWKQNRSKVKKCDYCTLYDLCNGIWKNYLLTYGDKEIEPVLDMDYGANSKKIKQNTIKINLKKPASTLDRNNPNFIEFDITKKDISKETGKKIIDFLNKSKGITLVIIKLLPKCMFDISQLKFIYSFTQPKSCKECIHFFSITPKGMIQFCSHTGIRGPKLSYVRDDQHISEYFDTFNNKHKISNNCKSCIYEIRNQCFSCYSKK